MKKEATITEVRLAQWIGLEHMEEVRRHKGKCNIFFGIGHRMRK